MRPEDAPTALENKDESGPNAMNKFLETVERAVKDAEADGLYMPAVVTALALVLDETKERFPDPVGHY